jgi:Zn-dependent peptidase ImmA (M78 family)/transcriptional regulator with XRE-family HTH domain
MPAPVVKITPSVLDWAVRDAGLTVKDVADALGEPVGTVHAWTRGDAAPTKKQFERLAKLLRRPTSFFLLARPPQQDDVPVAFRSAPGPAVGAGLTADEAALIRRAKRVQKVSGWLVQRAQRAAAVVPSVESYTAVEPAARQLRAWLGWGDDPKEWESDAQAARLVRADLESAQLLVLHMAMGSRGWRGFSLSSPVAPVVVANTYYNYRPRIFTYMHELVHLAVGIESICATTPDAQLERWCDQVASAILMPAGQLRSAVLAHLGGATATTFEDVRRISNVFRASLRATAVRLEQLGLGRAGLYDAVDSIARVREIKKGGGGSGEPQTTARVRLQTLGEGYLLPLLHAEAEHVLTRHDTMELLDVSAHQLTELRHLASSVTYMDD